MKEKALMFKYVGGKGGQISLLQGKGRRTLLSINLSVSNII